MRTALIVTLLFLLEGIASSEPPKGPPFVRFDLLETGTGEVVGFVKVVRRAADSIEIQAKLKDGVPGTTYGVCIPIYNAALDPSECAPIRVAADSNGKWTLDLTREISPNSRDAYAIQLTASHADHPLQTDVVVLPLAPN